MAWSLSEFRVIKSQAAALAFVFQEIGKIPRLFLDASRLQGHNHPHLNSSILVWSFAIEKLSPSHSDCLHSVK